MEDIEMKRTVIWGLLGMQVLTVLAQVIAADEPQPGTREYYSKHIEGRYCYRNGAMAPIPLSPPAVSAMPGVIRPPSLQALTGTVVQVAGTNDVIVRTSRRMPSGADKPEYAVLQLGTVDGVCAGQEIATNVVPTGSCQCVLASGVTNVLAGYRIPETPRTITFDEYLDVFKRDSQVEPIGQVIRIDRVNRALSYAERLRQSREARIRQISAASTNAPGLTQEELKKHLEQHQMQLIRSGQSPLPIPLTKEQDDQLVREGVLPPMEVGPTNKANQASEAVGATGAPQPQR
jgi:hypothetical protein